MKFITIHLQWGPLCTEIKHGSTFLVLSLFYLQHLLPVLYIENELRTTTKIDDAIDAIKYRVQDWVQHPVHGHDHGHGQQQVLEQDQQYGHVHQGLGRGSFGSLYCRHSFWQTRQFYEDTHSFW